MPSAKKTKQNRKPKNKNTFQFKIKETKKKIIFRTFSSINMISGLYYKNILTIVSDDRK
jgi:hypothetical protein